MNKFKVLCLSFSMIAISCKTNEAAKDQTESDTASVKVNESELWGNNRKFAAIINNANIANKNCNEDAAAIGIALVVETIPKFKEAATSTATSKIGDAIESGNLGALGEDFSNIRKMVTNILNISKTMMDKNYKAPEWSPEWDYVKVTYAANFAKIMSILDEAEEEEICRESITSINNVIMTMFPKKI